MVVKQTRIIFDLNEVSAVRLHCEHCHGDAVQAIKATIVPKQCPLCHEDWEVDLPQGGRGDNYALVRNMQRLIKADTPKMTIRFEIEGEED